MRDPIVIQAGGKVAAIRSSGHKLDRILLEFPPSRTVGAAPCAYQIQRLIKEFLKWISLLVAPPDEIGDYSLETTRVSSASFERTHLKYCSVERTALEKRVSELALLEQHLAADTFQVGIPHSAIAHRLSAKTCKGRLRKNTSTKDGLIGPVSLKIDFIEMTFGEGVHGRDHLDQATLPEIARIPNITAPPKVTFRF